MNPTLNDSPCACGAEIAYSQCCGLFHGGSKHPSTAAELMRSRFTAFAMKNSAYLLATWTPSKRPKSIDLSNDSTRWLRLEIVLCKKGRARDRKGIVEFKAFYQKEQEQRVMHEISRFHKLKGRWYYLDGIVKSVDTIT